jgi:hypothetical protein
MDAWRELAFLAQAQGDNAALKRKIVIVRCQWLV